MRYIRYIKANLISSLKSFPALLMLVLMPFLLMLFLAFSTKGAFNPSDLTIETKIYIDNQDKGAYGEQVMLHNPSILILDEPTVGVDAQSRQHIFDYIQSLAEQGTTILYTSHYMEEIEALCKRVFILDLGEEVAYGTKEEVKKLVGHTQTVALTLDRVPAGFDEVLKNSENGIQFVTVDGQDMELTIDQTIFSMMKLIEQVEQAQLVIKSVNVKETTLEEAFLQLTGKTLRD